MTTRGVVINVLIVLISFFPEHSLEVDVQNDLISRRVLVERFDGCNSERLVKVMGSD